jgi:glutamine amidotransferase
VKTVLIDYGAGNLHSVHKALARAEFTVTRTDNPEEGASADVLVLPGQGHFRQVMEAFLASGFETVVREHIAAGKPFLGICVGLQLLLEGSEEAPGVPGLGILPGYVKCFADPDVSVPHMGWNQLCKYGESALLKDIPDGAFVYFAHSYYADFADSLPGAVTTHGRTRFQSVLSSGPLQATQFHPEKSQAVGLKVLANFHALAAQRLKPAHVTPTATPQD